MSGESGPAIDPLAWIAANRALIDAGTAPPVVGGELTVLLVEGRGPRRDYHVNEVDELFYQVTGDIGVRLLEDGATRDVVVRHGELWLAPAGVPHSPQRPAGTLGLVVERARPAGSREAFRWYCATCGDMVMEVAGHRVPAPELRRAMAELAADAASRTCRTCGTVAPVTGA